MPENESHLEEHVLVIPRTLLEKIGIFQGLIFDMEKYQDVLRNPKHHSFQKRKAVEHDPSYKQLIPYALLCCGEEVFVYRRGKYQGEQRLFGNYSLGVGGHIAVTDVHSMGITYEQGLMREVTEEVTINTPYTKKAIALLNDDSNDVGKVHLGVVHIFHLEKPLVKTNEEAVIETCFMKPAELLQKKDEFENWSKICIENIEKIIS